MNSEVLTFLIPTIFCGTLAGFAFGLTAGGGSVIAVPLLVYALHLEAHKAVCVSMIAMTTLAFLAAVQKLRDSQIKVSAALTVAFAGMLSAPMGAWLNRRISEQTLLTLFAVVVVVVACRMFLSNGNHLQAEGCPTGVEQKRIDLRERFAVVGTGILSGTFAGLLGIGGGFIIVPSLIVFCGLEIHRAIATAFLSIALISVSAVASHLLAGQRVPLPLTGLFILGGIAGLAMGFAVGRRLSGRRLQRVFALMLLGMAILMFVRN